MSEPWHECYFNKFSPTKPQCPKEGKYRRGHTGNFTDNWTWCEEHKGREGAVPIRKERVRCF